MIKIGENFGNRYNYRQFPSLTSVQQKFIDLMTSDKNMFKYGQSLHGDTIKITLSVMLIY